MFQKSVFMMTTVILMGGALLSYRAEATITNAPVSQVMLDMSQHEQVPVKILADYRAEGYSGVIDLGTYTSIEDEKALKYYNERYDGNAEKQEVEMGCTAYIKEFEKDGKPFLMMGRNMDLHNSPYAAYVFKIDAPDRYKSINLTYSGAGMQTFAEIAKEGKMVKEMYEVLPYNVSDSINEKGLIIEDNMRDGTNKVSATGTNPGKPRYATPLLLRYLSDHAANIEEALKLLDNVDVYAPNKAVNWHFAFAMMDATGRYGVLEFVDNKPVWHEGQKGQANFWLSPDIYEKTDDNMGMARYQAVAEQDAQITNRETMAEAMKKVWYSQLFSKETAETTFDTRSEESGSNVQDILNQIKGWQKEYGITINQAEWDKVQKLADEHPEPLATTFCMADENRDVIDGLTNLITHSLMQLPPEKRYTTGMQEVTVFSFVADTLENVFYVRFFEQPQLYRYSFEGIAKVGKVQDYTLDAVSGRIK